MRGVKSGMMSRDYERRKRTSEMMNGGLEKQNVRMSQIGLQRRTRHRKREAEGKEEKEEELRVIGAE